MRKLDTIEKDGSWCPTCEFFYPGSEPSTNSDECNHQTLRACVVLHHFED